MLSRCSFGVVTLLPGDAINLILNLQLNIPSVQMTVNYLLPTLAISRVQTEDRPHSLANHKTVYIHLFE